METAKILTRKGARKLEDIPTEVKRLLNKGEIATVNLTEWLAIDQEKLIENTFPEMGLGKYIEQLKKDIGMLKKRSTMAVIKAVGQTMYELVSRDQVLSSTIAKLSSHGSDSVRCYATYLIALDTGLSIEERLTNSKPLIDDSHFGVREIVWMALRPEIVKNLSKSIELLSKWTASSSENIRRFTTEVTRPRGVWCKHIERLKENPALGLEVLEKLKSDPSKYVQDSVGNWLNDASKTQPEFVINLCEKWKEESPTKETQKIIKRAMRTINKKS